jgi:hypothetical protein
MFLLHGESGTNKFAKEFPGFAKVTQVDGEFSNLGFIKFMQIIQIINSTNTLVNYKTTLCYVCIFSTLSS